MRDWFRRGRKPAPEQPATISAQDRLIAALSGYEAHEWPTLSALAKVDAREHFYRTQGL